MIPTRNRLLAVLLSSALGLSVSPALAQSQVEIIRDDWGVPHVYADDVYGLFAGFGYAVAEDRLFQMEMSIRSCLAASTCSTASALPMHPTSSILFIATSPTVDSAAYPWPPRRADRGDTSARRLPRLSARSERDGNKSLAPARAH